MKPLLLHKARKLRLLGFADTVNYWRHRFLSRHKNKQFIRRNPHFPVPPKKLAFEAYGHLSWSEYAKDGALHAKYFSRQLMKHLPQPLNHPPTMLEWGCGAARISRHLLAELPEKTSITAVDIDPAAINWARANVPNINFLHSDTHPPLPFSTCTFDALFHYSVWTHLSDLALRSWIDELSRVLTPGGVLVGTTHGDHYLSIMLPQEQNRYTEHLPVFREQYEEGRKLYLSFLPPAYIKALLQAKFSRVIHLPGSKTTELPQDTWIAIK